MSAVVVLITKDRDVQLVASEDADVVVLDFQNTKVGDPLPVLSEAQKALLQVRAPSVLEDLALLAENYRCENCEAGFNSVEQFKPVADSASAFTQRGFQPAGGSCPGGGPSGCRTQWHVTMKQPSA